MFVGVCLIGVPSALITLNKQAICFLWCTHSKWKLNYQILRRFVAGNGSSFPFYSSVAWCPAQFKSAAWIKRWNNCNSCIGDLKKKGAEFWPDWHHDLCPSLFLGCWPCRSATSHIRHAMTSVNSPACLLARNRFYRSKTTRTLNFIFRSWL